MKSFQYLPLFVASAFAQHSANDGHDHSGHDHSKEIDVDSWQSSSSFLTFQATMTSLYAPKNTTEVPFLRCLSQLGNTPCSKNITCSPSDSGCLCRQLSDYFDACFPKKEFEVLGEQCKDLASKASDIKSEVTQQCKNKSLNVDSGASDVALGLAGVVALMALFQ